MGEMELTGHTKEPQRDQIDEAIALGERVRRLRAAAGLSQTELAGGRFSKEYVSQIERGKTRPTADTLAWLADHAAMLMRLDPAARSSL